MKKADKVAFIIDKLEELYPEIEIPLEHSDPYTLLVAVVLSAQSTDKKVNEITPELFAQARTPEQMVALGEDDIRAIIKPIGLSPQKARALYGLSKQLIEEFDSSVPRTFEELESLPGVGHKTASVVISQAFGEPAFPVDTHIHRLMHRWGLSSGKNVKQTEKDAKRLFPKELWNELHIRIILFGREYCPARGHDPEECPICSRL